jgi:hypothetical protein
LDGLATMVLGPCGTFGKKCSNSTNQIGSAGPRAGVAAAFWGGAAFLGAGAVAAVMVFPLLCSGVTHADGKVVCVDGVVVVAFVLVRFSARLFHCTQ